MGQQYEMTKQTGEATINCFCKTYMCEREDVTIFLFFLLLFRLSHTHTYGTGLNIPYFVELNSTDVERTPYFAGPILTYEISSRDAGT